MYLGVQEYRPSSGRYQGRSEKQLSGDLGGQSQYGVLADIIEGVVIALKKPRYLLRAGYAPPKYQRGAQPALC